jgi:hypothetical protein
MDRPMPIDDSGSEDKDHAVWVNFNSEDTLGISHITYFPKKPK